MGLLPALLAPVPADFLIPSCLLSFKGDGFCHHLYKLTGVCILHTPFHIVIVSPQLPCLPAILYAASSSGWPFIMAKQSALWCFMNSIALLEVSASMR